MKNIIKLPVFFALMTICASLFAGETVDKTLKAQPDGVVEIENIRGEIRVLGWDRNEVRVKGELDELTEKFIFETRGNTIYLEVEIPRLRMISGAGSDLTIYVPFNNSLDIEVISTNLTFKDIKGEIDAELVSGDVEIQNTENSIYIETVSGSIHLTKSSGKMRLSSVSGDITVDVTSKDIHAEVVSGDVTLKLAEFERLEASSISGDVAISGHLNDSGRLELETINGDIRMALNASVNARTSINVGPGGNITNRLSDDKVEDIFPHQQRLNLTLGNGSAKIDVSTVNGSVTLEVNH